MEDEFDPDDVGDRTDGIIQRFLDDEDDEADVRSALSRADFTLSRVHTLV